MTLSQQCEGTCMRFFELVRDLGALVGLGTGLFLICERFIKDRPRVFLSVKKGKLVLCIHNVAAQDIIVGPIETSPAVGLAGGDDLIDTIAAAAGSLQLVIVVKGASLSRVDVVWRKPLGSMKPDDVVRFKLPWKIAGNRWIWMAPIHIRKRVSELQTVLAAREMPVVATGA